MLHTNIPADVIVEPSRAGAGFYTVSAVWADVDRPNVGGISCRKPLAERIAKAMRDGVWFVKAEVATDVNGATYVAAQGLTIGKYANSTLKKMGR